jgi:lipoate-protein ligase A
MEGSHQRPPVHVEIDPSADLPAILQRTEGDLRAGRTAISVARLNHWAISLGVSQDSGEVFLRRCADRGLAVVRRSTGGTTVLHAPGDLIWTLVLPRADPRVGTNFVRAYPRLGEGVLQWLSSFGFDARWGESPGISPTFCLLGFRGQNLEVDSRVLGGAAQHLTNSTLLHHGTIVAQTHLSLIHDLFDLPEEIIRRRLIGLSDLGVDATDPRVLEELAKCLAGSPDSA